MKAIYGSTTLLILSGAAWSAHLPSAYPINGSFLVMCVSAGALILALLREAK